jgi:hypothetical protein
MPEKRPTEKEEITTLKEIFFEENILATHLVDRILEGVAEIVNEGFPEPFISYMHKDYGNPPDEIFEIGLSSSRKETDDEFEKRLEKWDAEEKIRKNQKTKNRIKKTKRKT